MASDSLVVKSYAEDEEEDQAEDEADFRTYQGVMGRPGIDFPVYRHIPATNFNCRDVKRPGYYADLATDCQVFHICDGGRKISFLCPNGTIFRQSHLICDWWFRVDCGKSVELYEESAEQLAADQKLYRERSMERDRRTKLGRKSEPKSDDDASGGEIYALDEPYNPRARDQQYNDDSRRNSKRVQDPRARDFNQRRGKSERRRPNSYQEDGNFQRINFNRVQETRTSNTNRPSTADSYKTQDPYPFRPDPTPTYEQGERTTSSRENIIEAESGSLVGNLRNSIRNENSLNFDSKVTEYRTHSSELPTQSVPISTESWRQEEQWQTSSKANTAEEYYQTTARQEPFPTYDGSLGTTQNYYSSTERYQSQDAFKYLPTSTTEEAPIYTESAVHTEPAVQTLTSTSPAITEPPPALQQFDHGTGTNAAGEERATTERIPPENIYLTTTFAPELEAEVVTTPRVDITLHQVSITKPTPQPEVKSNSYEDVVREGLEVPPSSGPNALRSFALYFAGKTANPSSGENATRNLFYIPAVKDIEEKLTFEERKKDVIKLVDDIIKGNAANQDKPSSPAEALPNSLTQQTKDSYSALFESNHTETTAAANKATEASFGTTAFEAFTEDAEKINVELRKNDLDSSQSRGPVDTESGGNHLNDEFSKVSPDLRELAQVFTKALSAYLDDPESFRRILSEIRPTEPAATEAPTTQTEYPSVTQEDDEVLDFSDVTKSSYRRRTTTAAYQETTTEYQTEPPTTTTPIPVKDLENVVLPLSNDYHQNNVKVPEVELTAPLLESLDESQSSYYTPPPRVVATTNTIAEEINREFTGDENLPDVDSNEAVDSYQPIRNTQSRLGGFQNNTRTTKYSPYGAELTSTTSLPYGADATTAPTTEAKANDATTFNPRNINASIHYRKQPGAIIRGNVEETELAKELNDLIAKDETRLQIVVPPIPEVPQAPFQSVKLGNGETVERTVAAGTTPPPPTTTALPSEAQPLGLSIELSPPFESEQQAGYYEYHSVLSSVPDVPGTTTDYPTTAKESPAETVPPATFAPYTSNAEDLTTPPPTMAPESIHRIMELQQTLMFNTENVTHQQMETAKATVEEAMDKVNMTETTADALMKMMEMAAKNETYRRLVLLLVNDKSGKNKTVEETRLALLRALLTPVISTTRSRYLHQHEATVPDFTSTTPTPPRDGRRRGNFRRSKSISGDTTRNVIRLTTETPRERTKFGRRTKMRVVTRVVKTAEPKSDSPTRLDLINRTVDNSRNNNLKSNSLDDAILNSDTRAVELLRSLYSLAARWG